GKRMSIGGPAKNEVLLGRPVNMPLQSVRYCAYSDPEPWSPAMAASTDRRRIIPVTVPPPPQEPNAAVTHHARRGGEAARGRFDKKSSAGSVAAGRMAARASRVSPTAEPPPSVEQGLWAGPQERRQRRRAVVPSMYSMAVIRDLSRKDAPIEAH